MSDVKVTVTFSRQETYDDYPDLSWLEQTDAQMGEGFEAHAQERLAAYRLKTHPAAAGAAKRARWYSRIVLQTYILRADIDPVRAVRTDADASICGDCPVRGIKGKGRTCYVNLGQGPRAVYAAFKAGKYPRAVAYAGAFYASRDNGALAVGHSMVIRLGTYGDPAAVPVDVWRALLRHSVGHTGYTHQWRTAPDLRELCMASVDSPEEADEAQAWGWRTFRVAALGDDVPVITMRDGNTRRVESLCPASQQAGKKLTCSKCLACAGADGRKGSIYIPVHGGFATIANVRARAAIAG